MTSIIDSLKDFFSQCPLLAGKGINVNYLGKNSGDYSIEGVPSSPVVKRYVDGEELRQYAFVFASREYYDEDELQNTETAEFYEKLCGWIEEKSAARELPVLEDALEAQRLEVTSTGFAAGTAAGSARFQLQCRLIYRK